MALLRIFSTLSFLLFFVYGTKAQVTVKGELKLGDTTQVHILHTRSDERLEGRVTGFDAEKLTFLLENQNIRVFLLSEIWFVEVKSEKTPVIPAKYDGTQGVTDNLLYTPTAWMLKRKQARYRNLMVLYNSLDYGFTDHINGGVSIFSILITGMVSARVKAGFKLGKYLHIAAAGQVFSIFLVETELAAGAMGYGVLTFGTSENYLNLGIGRAFAGDIDDPATAFNWGGSFRIHPKWRLFGEYLVLRNEFDGKGVLSTLGTSWFNQEHRVDAGVTVLPSTARRTGLIPVAGYAYRF